MPWVAVVVGVTPPVILDKRNRPRRVTRLEELAGLLSGPRRDKLIGLWYVSRNVAGRGLLSKHWWNKLSGLLNVLGVDVWSGLSVTLPRDECACSELGWSHHEVAENGPWRHSSVPG